MKLRLLFLFVLLSSCAFAQSDDPALKTQSDVIRFETIPGRNTGVREANMFDALKDAKVSRLESYTASGTNTYTLTVPWLTSYKTNVQLAIYFTNANTGASTINVNSFGAKSIVTNTGSSLTGGELKGYVEIIYDGTNFQIAWTSSIAGGSHSLTVDNSSLQLNSGTSYNGSADKTISVKNAGITNAMLANPSITIAGNSTSLGGSVTQDQITGLSSTGLLKRTGANTLAIAVAGTDYLASGSSWLLASGGTLTGPNSLIGTPTNRIQFIFNSLGTTQTDGAGLWLQNQNGATNGNQEISPLITWEGRGFATGVNNSQSVKYAADVLPVQAATNPTATWRLRYSINGAAYADALQWNSTTNALLIGNAGNGNGVGSSAGHFNFYIGATKVGNFTGSGSGTGALTVGNAGNAAFLYVFQPAISGGYSVFRTDPGAHTAITASTEAVSVDFRGATHTWATGTLALQRFNYFRAYTLAFAGASTVTESYNVYIENPVIGTNGTIGANSMSALGVNGTTKLIGNVPNTSHPVLIIGGAISSTNRLISLQNLAFNTEYASLNVDASSNVQLKLVNGISFNVFNAVGSFNVFSVVRNGFVNSTGAAVSSGWASQLAINPGAHTAITASTELLGSIINVAAVTQQWATGNLTTQRFNYFGAPTISFVASSTATNVYNVYVEDPVAGTNATITSKWSAGFAGNIIVGGATGTVAAGQVGLAGGNANLSLVVTSGTFLSSNSNRSITMTQSAASNSWTPAITSTPGNHTSLTAATEFISRDYQGATWTWTDGTTATQRFNYLRGFTLNKTTTSATFTNVYTEYIDASTAGTGVTLSNNWALGLNGALQLFAGTTSMPPLVFQSGTNSTLIINGAMEFDGTHFYGAISGSRVQLDNQVLANGWLANGATTITANTSQAGAFTETMNFNTVSINQRVQSGSISEGFRFNAGAHTSLTAGLGYTDIIFDASPTIQFSTGSLGESDSFILSSRTYAFVGASTLTLANGLKILAPKAGTNATITDAVALYIQSTNVANGGSVTTGTGLFVNAPTGATSNYSAQFVGGIGMKISQTAQSTSHTFIDITQSVHTGGTPTGFKFTGGAHTGLAASNVVDFYLNTARTVQFASNPTIANVYVAYVDKPTYSFATAGGIITAASTFTVASPVNGGTNATITSSYGIEIASASLTNITNSYALSATASSGATNNYSAQFVGGLGVKLSHLIGNTSAPSIAAGTGAGTSPTVSVTGTDLGGYVTITTGTGSPAATAIIATITFNSAYASAPRVVIYPANRAARDLAIGAWPIVPGNGQTNGTTTTTFVLESGTALATSTTYLWHYLIIQ